MNHTSPLLVERDGAVAVLTLNRPSTRNALNRELVVALGAALTETTADRAVRAVVLTGSGGGFCSGADLRSGMSEGGDVDMAQRIDEYHAMIRAIVHARQPFVAAVDGAAVGFGADLALACDLRILSTRGYLQEKFVKIGLMPDGGGTFWVPRLVGLGRALELLLLGTKIEAARALELGLCNRVVEPDQLLNEARALAAELAKGPPLAFERIKAAVRESFRGGIEDALAREKAGQLELLGSNDMMEGVLAWAQRREPEFRGR
jgi:2-(1,2-epoxy-1,2-dihydrophenyl)acetyl-CoA isomerase